MSKQQKIPSPVDLFTIQLHELNFCIQHFLYRVHAPCDPCSNEPHSQKEQFYVDSLLL